MNIKTFSQQIRKYENGFSDEYQSFPPSRAEISKRASHTKNPSDPIIADVVPATAAFDVEPAFQ